MAVTAESVVVELLARTDDFERKIGRAATSFETNMRGIEGSTRRVGAASVNLGQQIQDISIGLSTGQSPFTVLAQQAGQTAFAVSEFGGTLGKVGAFIAGPYGSIIVAATAVLGNLALAHINSGDGAKTQEEAEKALATALGALDQATGVSNTSQRENIRLKKEAAKAALQQARDELAAAKASVATQEARALAGRGRTGNFGLPQNDEGVTGARANAVRLAKVLSDAEARIDSAAAFGNANLSARAAVDPIERIRQASEVKVDAIKALNLSQAETTKRLTALYREEEAAIARVSEAARKAPRARSPRLTAEQRRFAALDAESPVDTARRVASTLPETSARDTLGLASLNLPDVVLDFEKLRDTVGDISKIKFIDAESLATGQRFAENLTQTLGQAVIFSGNIGDALVNSLKAAAAEAIGSGLLSILTGGRAGRSFGSTLAGIGSIFGFAGGGPVNAGQVIKINETGQELFRPSVPGRIIPAGQAAMMGGGGGASIVQNLNINFAGNAATREEAATFARIAYEQSLRAFREAGAFGVPSV